MAEGNRHDAAADPDIETIKAALAIVQEQASNLRRQVAELKAQNARHEEQELNLRRMLDVYLVQDLAGQRERWHRAEAELRELKGEAAP